MPPGRNAVKTRSVDSSKTVMFADLTGSTSLYEAVGDSEAARIVTALTQWIGEVCEASGGRVVKTLGDGVLALFPTALHAVVASVQLQREHLERHSQAEQQMGLKIGLASGTLVEVDGDCYGDAVNVASRLADLSGSGQIWCTEAASDEVKRPPPGARMRWLGPVPVRGKSEPLMVVRIEWDREVATGMMTLPGWGQNHPAAQKKHGATIELTCLDAHGRYTSDDVPIHFGRSEGAEFVVSDPRVSRLHARIDWRGNHFVLTDLSSYGTWVRFKGTTTQVPLRRSETLLLSSGEIALGASLDDFTVPVVQFTLGHD